MLRIKSCVLDHCQLLKRNGKKYAKCVYCTKKYAFANVTHMADHLLSCVKCPYYIKSSFKKYSTNIKPFPVTSTRVSTHELPSTSASAGENSLPLAAQPQLIPPSGNLVKIELTDSDSSVEREPIVDNTDAALARAVYSSGLPLNLFESKYWQNSIDLLKSNYKPPTKYAMSNALLDAEYHKIKTHMDLKIKSAMVLGLVIDGCTNICGKGVVNFIITTPEPIFWKSLHPGAKIETADYFSNQIANVLEEIGPLNFVAIITDSTRTMRAAWRQVQSLYPHIDCISSAAHVLSFLFNDIMKLSSYYYEECKKII